MYSWVSLNFAFRVVEGFYIADIVIPILSETWENKDFIVHRPQGLIANSVSILPANIAAHIAGSLENKLLPQILQHCLLKLDIFGLLNFRSFKGGVHFKNFRTNFGGFVLHGGPLFTDVRHNLFNFRINLRPSR